MTQMCELLERRLNDVLSLLQAGKCEEAEALVSSVDMLLAYPIDAEHLHRLRHLQNKCLEAARVLELSLSEKLRQSGMSRRASAAYQHAPNGVLL